MGVRRAEQTSPMALTLDTRSSDLRNFLDDANTGYCWKTDEPANYNTIR